MFDYKKIMNDFGLDSQTSSDMLDAIQNWSNIFNKKEPWIDKNTVSLHVAHTICETVAKAVTIEFKSECDDPKINEIYQLFLRKIRRNTEYAIGKSCEFFKPSYENGKIVISVIQGDKFIPISFDDSGKLISCIIIDQISKGTSIYTRLEYNELKDNKLIIKNIVYEGEKNNTILSKKIQLSSVDKWKDLEENLAIDGIDRLIGGFFTMNNTNDVDNNSPLGVAIFHNALDTLKEIDKQFSRTLWEYEGSELAIDLDESMIPLDNKGNPIYPNGKKRLYRKLITDDSNKDKWNIFNPEIRDTALFNGLNELLRQAEIQCSLGLGTLCKPELIEKTATEIKSAKQNYYITVSDIQTSLQYALDDLIYGIYVLCKLYNIPVNPTYSTTYDWDDSILVDKESLQKQSMVERNAEVISDVQYIMETRDYNEEEAIKFIQNQQRYKKLFAEEEQKDPEEE